MQAPLSPADLAAAQPAQLTTEEAIAFAEQRKWEPMTPRERALFQLQQDKLCMPFGEFHKAIESALGRPVWTHEFGLNRAGLLAELQGTAPAPSLAEIAELVPEAKRLIVGT